MQRMKRRYESQRGRQAEQPSEQYLKKSKQKSNKNSKISDKTLIMNGRVWKLEEPPSYKEVSCREMLRRR
ncbi:hypothetical protein GWI33_011888 [Rhynchophorus ferrugineus]|uniref:Uncharacterized protein n=1 Tax=Rhynchophorus ferrugineus TaxID=354439 RepID=A0A834IA88_RHYFE|nr:hypothetical protein GWI33_011888 [Rhynchophorus ferrugineus]